MSWKNSDDIFVKMLLEAPNYRDFISLLIKERKKTKNYGYSKIARSGGFLSRSFPRDVVLGKKRITLSSLPKFIKGLNLHTDLAQYFKILVEIEEPDCRFKNFDITKLNYLKNNLKNRIYRKSEIQINAKYDLNFIYPSIPKIYAALGDSENGSTINNIILKTNILDTEILKCLNYMLDRKLIRKYKGKYFSTENHLNFQNLNSEIFKKHFIKSAEDSILMCRQNIKSSEKLFLSSSFSVARKDLEKLKEELRSILLKFVDCSENPNGDKVVSLIASLY